MNIPTIAADISATKVAPNKALSPKADKIGFFPGAIPPTPPIRIPIEAKFAKPHNTYVAMITDLGEENAPACIISARL